MKRVIFLIFLLVVLSGCSAYREINYEVIPEEGLAIKNDSGETIPKWELIGQYCRIELNDGSVLDGEIQALSQNEIRITNEEHFSAMESSRKYLHVVSVKDISGISAYSGHSGQPFRLIRDTYSSSLRTTIPADSGHAPWRSARETISNS